MPQILMTPHASSRREHVITLLLPLLAQIVIFALDDWNPSNVRHIPTTITIRDKPYFFIIAAIFSLIFAKSASMAPIFNSHNVSSSILF
jgi:hypothetical protein